MTPESHLVLSSIKSAFRIAGLITMLMIFELGVSLLIVAEIVGVIEEI